MSPNTAITNEIAMALTIVKTLILIVGSVITYFAWKAHRRTNNPALRDLTIGFGLIVLGSFLGGATYHLLGTELATGVIVEGVIVLTGFGFIAYSLRER